MPEEDLHLSDQTRFLAHWELVSLMWEQVSSPATLAFEDLLTACRRQPPTFTAIVLMDNVASQLRSGVISSTTDEW